MSASDQASRAAQLVLTQLGIERSGRAPRTPTLADLEPLALEYLRITGTRADVPRLGEAPYLVSMAAAREYGAIRRIASDELARRDLTVRIHHAQDQGGRRFRSRDREMDIAITVAEEQTEAGSLLVVAHTHTRRVNERGQ